MAKPGLYSLDLISKVGCSSFRGLRPRLLWTPWYDRINDRDSYLVQEMRSGEYLVPSFFKLIAGVPKSEITKNNYSSFALKDIRSMRVVAKECGLDRVPREMNYDMQYGGIPSTGLCMFNLREDFPKMPAFNLWYPVFETMDSRVKFCMYIAEKHNWKGSSIFIGYVDETGLQSSVQDLGKNLQQMWKLE